MNDLRATVQQEIQTVQTSLTQWREVLADAQNTQRTAQQQVEWHQVDLRRLEWLLEKLGTEAEPAE